MASDPRHGPPPGDVVARCAVRSTWRPIDVAGMCARQSSMLADLGLAHAFTCAPHSLSHSALDDANEIQQRRMRICSALGVESSCLAWMQQVHGCQIGVLQDQQAGGLVGEVDGMIARSPGYALLGFSADCPLVLVGVPGRRALGLAHAGWRGTVAGLTHRLVQSLVDCTGASAADMYAAISPSAGPCCYEVGQDVVDQVVEALPSPERLIVRHAAMCFDLWTANVDQLVRAGIRRAQIDLAAACTICDQQYFSYRRNGAGHGHAGLIAGWPEDARTTVSSF